MKKALILLLPAVYVMCGLTAVAYAIELDPAGAKIGGGADVVGASANEPTAEEQEGLDEREVSVVAYPDFAVKKDHIM